MSLLVDVKKNNKPSLGGFRRVIYYALASWIDDEPIRLTDPQTTKENTHLVGDFLMYAGQTFRQLEGVFQKSSLGIETIGEMGISSAWKGMPKFKLLNNNDDAYSFLLEAHKPSGEFVFIIPLNDGRKVVIGEKYLPCLLAKGTGSFPEKIEEGAVIDVEFEYSGYAPLFYDGIIPGITKHSGSDIVEVV